MAHSSKNGLSPLGRLIFWVACFALVVSFIIFVLEKSQIVNFYSKPVSSTSAETTTLRPVNDINYEPASSTDNDAINAKKDNGAVDAPVSQTLEPSKPISITLTAAGQDTNGGPVIIRTILGNATAGTCTITLTKESSTKTYSVPVVWRGTYYSCNGFDVPYSDLSPGTWQLTLTATQDSITGNATKDITIKAL